MEYYVDKFYRASACASIYIEHDTDIPILSIRPSVRLSAECWCCVETDASSNFPHHLKESSLYYFETNQHYKIRRCSPLAGSFIHIG